MTGIRSLSVHQLTALDVAPATLVDLTARCGASAVSIFTHLPAGIPLAAPILEGTRAIEVFADRLRRHAVSLLNIEYFPLRETTDIDGYGPPLATGARLGARRVTTHLFHARSDHRVAAFRRLADITRGLGMELALEFTAASAIPSLNAAAELLEEADRPCTSLTIDLLQFARTGGQAADLRGNQARFYGTVQLADGPSTMPPERRMAESLGERLVPGSGELALVDWIRAMPAHVAFEVEVPQTMAKRDGSPPIERVRRALAGARGVLVAADRIPANAR